MQIQEIFKVHLHQRNGILMYFRDKNMHTHLKQIFSKKPILKQRRIQKALCSFADGQFQKITNIITSLTF